MRRQLESDVFVEIVALVQLRSNVIRERVHGFYLRAGYERVKSSYLFRRRVR